MIAYLTLIIFLANAPVAHADGLTASLRTDVLFSGETADVPSDSPINPGNSLDRIPNAEGSVNWRPNLDVSDGMFRLMARPRLSVVGNQLGQSGETSGKAAVDVWGQEETLAFHPADEFHVEVGRQNFQWGPSEAVSPSNIFFPPLQFRLDPYTEILGITMARANWSSGKNWSVVAMAEMNPLPDSSIASAYQPKEQSLDRMMVKAEYASDDGQMSAALLVGKTASRDSMISSRTDLPVIGDYAMWSINDVFQIYTDDRLETGTDREFPISPTEFATRNSQLAYVYSTLGLRTTFSDGTEWRNEWIHQDLGESKNQIQWALANPASLELSALYFSGQLLGTDYLYSSLRFRKNTANLIFRILASLADSELLMASYDAGLTDSWSFSLYTSVGIGPKNGEFRLLTDASGGLTLRWSL